MSQRAGHSKPPSSPPPKIVITDAPPVAIKSVNGPTLKTQRPPAILSATTAFSILLLIRLFSAAFATIPDCDEVFNYWEPLHYLSHGYGLQTWEYSPVYAIRSWAYVGLHAVLSRGFSLLPQLEKVHEFYGLRCLFAAACAYCETRLYSAISSNINRRIGLLYLAATLTSAGMFHAATAFLPSTLAMYTSMLGMTSFIEPGPHMRAVRGMFWFAVGGLLGWPFSMAMCIPFVLEECFAALYRGRVGSLIVRYMRAAMLPLVVLAVITGVDFVAYRKLEFVPLNIVLYNVFSGPGRGPDIYGTEPWWFYLANLSLNFNLLLPLALLSWPAMLIYLIFYGPTRSGFPGTIVSLSTPFYLWLAIFSLQPHKEERFMYVFYPALCLNASTTFHVILTMWGTLSARFLPGGRPRELLHWSVLGLPLLATMLLSVSRILAIVSAYSAPLEIYSALPLNATGNLCLAKEWYRYPSSYHVPDGVRARFVKSAFDGLLPGQFEEGEMRPGTWREPQGMNDMNIGDPGKYVTLDDCDYMVESYFKNQEAYELDSEWSTMRCEDFLDAAHTPTLGRVFWVPKWIPNVRNWGRYCLFRRERQAVAEKGE